MSTTKQESDTRRHARLVGRWREHAIRNKNGWVGIIDTQHPDAGHIAGWIRPEDLELTLAALNHFEPLRKTCSRCGGGGWVPSMTEADTDPCPECSFPPNADVLAPAGEKTLTKQENE